jgi:hypothetical protein
MSQMVEDIFYGQMDGCGEFMKGVTFLRYEIPYFLTVSLYR